ncbi:MAG TPA: hypothetical protein VMN57_00360 [Anaerolineales bacterium]|nr:hypothetical protein [Anaerolineales bacterium]
MTQMIEDVRHLNPWISAFVVLFTASCASVAPAGAGEQGIDESPGPNPSTITQASATELPTPTIPATVDRILTGTPQPAATVTASITPTRTATPEPTAPALPQAIITNLFVIVRSGPGEIYSPVAVLGNEMIVGVVGSNVDQTWLYIDLLLDQYGWILTSTVLIDPDGPALAVIDPPPKPTTPPAYLSAWVLINGYGDLYRFNIQLFNFKNWEYIEVVVARIENGVIDTRRFVNFDSEKTNIIEISFQHSSVTPGRTYKITATGDMGSSAVLIYSIP